MVSKKFLQGHPRAGEPTNFKEMILKGQKIHTARPGKKWKQYADEINRGEAYLSLREWTGKPYNSKQFEFARCYKLGVEKFWPAVDFNVMDMGEFSENDGLTVSEMKNWFPVDFSGYIIHFTNMLYGIDLGIPQEKTESFIEVMPLLKPPKHPHCKNL